MSSIVSTSRTILPDNIDATRLNAARTVWEEKASALRISRASEYAETQRKLKAEGCARKTAFVQNVTKGNTALSTLTARLVQEKQRSEEIDAESARLYGSTLTLQRTAYVLAELMGDAYPQHLSSPAGLTRSELTCLSAVTSSVEETTRVVIRVINVLKTVLEGQHLASTHIQTITSVLDSCTIDDSILVDLAHGSASDAFAKTLDDTLREMSPYTTARQDIGLEEAEEPIGSPSSA
jgi:hypothetical protein